MEEGIGLAPPSWQCRRPQRSFMTAHSTNLPSISRPQLPYSNARPFWPKHRDSARRAPAKWEIIYNPIAFSPPPPSQNLVPIFGDIVHLHPRIPLANIGPFLQVRTVSHPINGHRLGNPHWLHHNSPKYHKQTERSDKDDRMDEIGNDGNTNDGLKMRLIEGKRQNANMRILHGDEVGNFGDHNKDPGTYPWCHNRIPRPHPQPHCHNGKDEQPDGKNGQKDNENDGIGMKKRRRMKDGPIVQQNGPMNRQKNSKEKH